MLPANNYSHAWGSPPWVIDFSPQPQELPHRVDFAVIGAGFTGLCAAAWLRLHDPEKSVVVLEAGSIGAGASGRTGGMALAETAAGDPPGLGDVLAGLNDILNTLRIECDLALPGAWEIGRSGGLPDSPISWNDSGNLRVVDNVPGGSLDPGKLLSGLARAAEERGAVVREHHRVTRVNWGKLAELEIQADDRTPRPASISAQKVLFATNALSLGLSGLQTNSHPKLTLAAMTAPLGTKQLEELGLASGKPFYTLDLPYLWGRTRHDRSIVWGAGLVDPPSSGSLEDIRIDAAEPARIFAQLEKRLHNLHPALVSARITHRWGGPILFREDWEPVFDWHPQSRDGIVIGAFAGHGVALSNYLGAWAADVFLGRRTLPSWGKR